jgi:hypothetical protein
MQSVYLESGGGRALTGFFVDEAKKQMRRGKQSKQECQGKKASRVLSLFPATDGGSLFHPPNDANEPPSCPGAAPAAAAGVETIVDLDLHIAHPPFLIRPRLCSARIPRLATTLCSQLAGARWHHHRPASKLAFGFGQKTRRWRWAPCYASTTLAFLRTPGSTTKKRWSLYFATLLI